MVEYDFYNDNIIIKIAFIFQKNLQYFSNDRILYVINHMVGHRAV